MAKINHRCKICGKFVKAASTRLESGFIWITVISYHKCGYSSIKREDGKN